MTTLDDAAKALGIALLPWQKECGERVLAGERIYMLHGRRQGLATWRRVLAEAQKILDGNSLEANPDPSTKETT